MYVFVTTAIIEKREMHRKRQHNVLLDPALFLRGINTLSVRGNLSKLLYLPSLCNASTVLCQGTTLFFVARPSYAIQNHYVLFMFHAIMLLWHIVRYSCYDILLTCRSVIFICHTVLLTCHFVIFICSAVIALSSFIVLSC